MPQATGEAEWITSPSSSWSYPRAYLGGSGWIGELWLARADGGGQHWVISHHIWAMVALVGHSLPALPAQQARENPPLTQLYLLHTCAARHEGLGDKWPWTLLASPASLCDFGWAPTSTSTCAWEVNHRNYLGNDVFLSLFVGSGKQWLFFIKIMAVHQGPFRAHEVV